MAGLLGIFAFDEAWNVSRFLYFSMKAIRNRGQESSSMVTYSTEFSEIDGLGDVEEVLSEEKVESLRGHIGLGGVSTERRKIFQGQKGKVRVLFSGVIKGVGENLKAAEYLSKEMNSFRELEEFVSFLEELDERIYGSLLALGEGFLLSYRDSSGIRPLLKGNLGFDLAIFSSELASIDVIGGDYFMDLNPGEINFLDKYGLRKEIIGEKKRKFCVFEYVYLSRHDNVWNSIHVEEVRNEIGRQLAREHPPEEDSVVIAVPETARPFANGFSQEAGIPQRLGFERIGRHVRAAIKPTQYERLMGIQLKHNVIRSAVWGKKVYVLDDSVVRGNTLRNTVYWLRRRGAKEVHVRIGSPHLIHPCRYGIEVPIRDELIAAHNTEEEISRIIGADSFRYLSTEGLIKAIGLKESELCMECMKGASNGGD
ncbi:amidophosphoribosyltransferase [Thermococci archaeon]|nr:MAG: amidophosphoribosyltransferase [Thermococci archaeon]